MTPQLQRYRGDVPGEFGDCHRTCVAMILNMARDDVPHFMEDLPPGTPADDPRSQECVRREIEWLAQHGLGFVNIPFPGDQDIAAFLDMLKVITHGCPVVMGCSTGYGDHSVVVWQGEIYNPNNSTIVGPMSDGFWWLTIYSVGPNWVERKATRALSFMDGWEACEEAEDVHVESKSISLEDALDKYLQAPIAKARVAIQEVD